ncbi:MAG: hypothetical protein ACKO96_04530, partial [Flammeovirgaceae bacterium]
MPIFKYKQEIAVKGTDDVILKIDLIDPGSAAHHLIDLPGSDDKEVVSSCTVTLGKGKALKKERTI